MELHIRFRQIIPFVASFCAVLCLCAPTQADLLYSADHSECTATIASWYAKHVPAAYQSDKPLLINEYNDRQMNAYLVSGSPNDTVYKSSENGQDDLSDVDGVYENGPARITVRVPRNGAVDLFTFAHEYGHYVWFNILSGHDRSNYEAIYNRQKINHHLVTRYASTNVEEGFAEAFSFYTNQAAMLKYRDSESFAFLDLFGNGNPSE